MAARAKPVETRLERRPEATSYLVEDLMQAVRDGRVRVPSFQRRMRWDDRDRLDLFDSIYKGYPIGTLLLWRRDAPSETVRFGDFAVAAEPRRDALFLVDGQQRVTTLASTLLVTRAAGDRAVVFDLEAEEFRYGRIRPGPAQGSLLEDAGRVEVPVATLFDSSALIRWAAEPSQRTMRAELVARALECGKRLREYRVPAYVVESASADVLRIVFDRTNRTGHRLDEVDVFHALFSAETRDLASVAAGVASAGFGLLPESTVLKALRAIGDLPLDKDFTAALGASDVPAMLSRTSAALERVVRFLSSEASIPHWNTNPYELPVVVLARLFDRFPEPSARSRTLLRRWVWRGSLAGRLTGAAVGLRQHVAAVGESESESVQGLLSLSGESADVNVELEPFSLKTAKTSMLLCALASLEPRDLRDGERLDVRGLFEDPSHALARVTKDTTPELARTLANRLLHPVLPPSELTEKLLAADEATLASHAVPGGARDALGRGDLAGFLEGRASRIRAVARDFFASLAEPGADDSPAIASLEVDDE